MLSIIRAEMTLEILFIKSGLKFVRFFPLHISYHIVILINSALLTIDNRMWAILPMGIPETLEIRVQKKHILTLY